MDSPARPANRGPSFRQLYSRMWYNMHMNTEQDFQDFYDGCLSMIKQYPESLMPSCLAFADCGDVNDNVLWFVEFLDDEHRSGVVAMLSGAIKLRDADRYGLVMHLGGDRYIVTAAGNDGASKSQFLAVHRDPDGRVSGMTQEARLPGYEWATRLFEMGQNLNDDRLQIAECGLMMAILSGSPKIVNGAIGQQKAARRTSFH